MKKEEPATDIPNNNNNNDNNNNNENEKKMNGMPPMSESDHIKMVNALIMDPMFKMSNMMYTINGYVYGNLQGIQTLSPNQSILFPDRNNIYTYIYSTCGNHILGYNSFSRDNDDEDGEGEMVRDVAGDRARSARRALAWQHVDISGDAIGFHRNDARQCKGLGYGKYI